MEHGSSLQWKYVSANAATGRPVDVHATPQLSLVGGVCQRTEQLGRRLICADSLSRSLQRFSQDANLLVVPVNKYASAKRCWRGLAQMCAMH